MLHWLIPKRIKDHPPKERRRTHVTFIDSKKDKPKPVKYSTRPKHNKVKVCGQCLKELNKTLVECLDNFKWPQSTTRGHVFQKEADERIQFGVTTSYSDGIVISAATGKDGKHNQLMNLLIRLAQFCNPGITYSTVQVTKTLRLDITLMVKIGPYHISTVLDHFLVVVCG